MKFSQADKSENTTCWRSLPCGTGDPILRMRGLNPSYSFIQPSCHKCPLDLFCHRGYSGTDGHSLFCEEVFVEDLLHTFL